jgi:hypothetical protein
VKSKIQVATVLALMIAALSAPSGSVIAKDGTGPMCFPGTPCPISGQQFASVVAKDGPGPVCPPSTGCMV